MAYGTTQAIKDATGHPDAVDAQINDLNASANDIAPRSAEAADILRNAAIDIEQDATSPYDIGRAEAISRDAVAEARTVLQRDEGTRAESRVTPSTLRVTRTNDDDDDPDPCEIGPYREMRRRCRSRGGEAHHIVPDYTLRYGPRPTSGVTDTQRIPGIPSLTDGPAICLSGAATVVGGEHYSAHRTTDSATLTAGASNDVSRGTTDWRTVRRESLNDIRIAKPECHPQAVAAVRASFGNVAPNQVVRATLDYRHLSGEARDALVNGSRFVDGKVVP